MNRIRFAIAAAALSLATRALGAESATPTPTPTPSIVAETSPTATPTALPDADRQLEIEVVGLRNSNGKVGCSLFNSADGFPRAGDKLFKHVWASIEKNRAVCVYKGIAAGRYAAVVYHDENKNGEFDRNAFGMPKEGYGFSRDAAALFDTPSFDAAAIDFSSPRLTIFITIRY
jgi:uncharacterized protein (DUF2141 family)